MRCLSQTTFDANHQYCAVFLWECVLHNFMSLRKMVLYTCKESYFRNAFNTANQLRLKKELCDIKLFIGTEIFHAHRIVLAAGSDYFRTLFVGLFSESSKSEVDLSSTTSDFQTFKCILDFLYEGQVEIKSDNLADLMKLSSCLLITQLQEFCTEFVLKNLILSKALKFYFYPLQYGYVDLEKEISPIIKSRFHDNFIFQSVTLKLSPDQIGHLFENGFMERCTWSTVLKFLPSWIFGASTEQHLSIAKYIVEKIDTESVRYGNVVDMYEAKQQYFDINEALGRMTTKLKSNKSVQGKQIVKICEQLLESLSTQKTSDVLNQGLRQVKSRLGLDSQPQLQKSSVAEDVLVVISNRQCVINAVDELIKSTLDFDSIKESDMFREPVFDVCSYSPRTKEWRYLFSLTDDGKGNSLLKSSCYCPWEFSCVGDRVYSVAYADTYISPAYVLNLEDFSAINDSEGYEEGRIVLPDGFKSEFSCVVQPNKLFILSVLILKNRANVSSGAGSSWYLTTSVLITLMIILE